MLAKTMLNSIEVLLSKDLIDLNSSHDEFVSINNVLKEYNDTKKEIESLKTSTLSQIFETIYKNNVILLYEVQKKYRKTWSFQR